MFFLSFPISLSQVARETGISTKQRKVRQKGIGWDNERDWLYRDDAKDKEKKEKPTVPLAGLVDDWPLDTRVF